MNSAIFIVESVGYRKKLEGIIGAGGKGSQGREGGGLVNPLCSQNAHDETVLVRCAQLGFNQATPLEGKNTIKKTRVPNAPGARTI